MTNDEHEFFRKSIADIERAIAIELRRDLVAIAKWWGHKGERTNKEWFYSYPVVSEDAREIERNVVSRLIEYNGTRDDYASAIMSEAYR